MSQTTAPAPPESRAAVLRRLFIRVALACVLAGSILLANWSWNRLQPVQQRLVGSGVQLTRLADELHGLEMRWDPEEAQRVEALFNQVNAALFSSTDEITNWQAAAENEVRRQGLQGTFRRGAPEVRTNGLQKLSVIPVSVNVHPDPASLSTNTAYRSLLKLLHALDSTNKHADLVELTATGNSNSVQQAHVVYHLLTKEESLR